MASYVVDTSVVIQYFITQIYTSEAQVLIAQMYQKDRLLIPEFCLLECVNVLWKEVRFRELPLTQAEQMVDELQALAFQIIPVKSLLLRALTIGINQQIPIYDSLYIALALNFNCPLITVDEKQASGANASGVILKPITDFSPQ